MARYGTAPGTPPGAPPTAPVPPPDTEFDPALLEKAQAWASTADDTDLIRVMAALRSHALAQNDPAFDALNRADADALLMAGVVARRTELRRKSYRRIIGADNRAEKAAEDALDDLRNMGYPEGLGVATPTNRTKRLNQAIDLGLKQEPGTKLGRAWKKANASSSHGRLRVVLGAVALGLALTGIVGALAATDFAWYGIAFAAAFVAVALAAIYALIRRKSVIGPLIAGIAVGLLFGFMVFGQGHPRGDLTGMTPAQQTIMNNSCANATGQSCAAIAEDNLADLGAVISAGAKDCNTRASDDPCTQLYPALNANGTFNLTGQSQYIVYCQNDAVVAQLAGRDPQPQCKMS